MLKQIGCTIGLAAIALASISVGSWETPAVASDHDEAPLVKADSSLDVTDVYVFGSGDGKTTLIACWDGLNLETGEAPYAQGPWNLDALYTFNIDNAGPDGELDGVADLQIRWRYGQDQYGNYAVRFEDVPGAGENPFAEVDTVFEGGDGTSLWSGTADDPFFFDAGGYLSTVANGTIFDEENGGLFFTGADFLAGFNVKAAAIEIDTALLQDEENPGPFQVWVTSATL